MWPAAHVDFAHCQNVVLQGTQPVGLPIVPAAALDNRQDVDETRQLSGAWRSAGRSANAAPKATAVARNSAAAATAKRLCRTVFGVTPSCRRSGETAGFLNA